MVRGHQGAASRNRASLTRLSWAGLAAVAAADPVFYTIRDRESGRAAGMATPVFDTLYAVLKPFQHGAVTA